ncbi:MAG: toll/interleukin-1 receptor domain-containing protein [Afipia sp.]|nr:toll/interleukin-1 receptor domain-containing protein [Afipia sp.]
MFISYAKEDRDRIRCLYNRLRRDHLEPWWDQNDLFPGDDWRMAIKSAVRACDVVLVCLSERSVPKTGFFQKEIAWALDFAEEKPEGTIYLIPVRLDNCQVPVRLEKWQWADLFAKDGYERLRLALVRRAFGLGLAIGPSETATRTKAVPKTSPTLEGSVASQPKDVYRPVARATSKLMLVVDRGQRLGVRSRWQTASQFEYLLHLGMRPKDLRQIIGMASKYILPRPLWDASAPDLTRLPFGAHPNVRDVIAGFSDIHTSELTRDDDFTAVLKRLSLYMLGGLDRPNCSLRLRKKRWSRYEKETAAALNHVQPGASKGVLYGLRILKQAFLDA